MTAFRLPFLILGALVVFAYGKTTYQEISLLGQLPPECNCQCTVPVCTPVTTAPAPLTTLAPVSSGAPSAFSFSPTVFGTAVIPALPPSVSRAPTFSAPVKRVQLVRIDPSDSQFTFHSSFDPVARGAKMTILSSLLLSLSMVMMLTFADDQSAATFMGEYGQLAMTQEHFLGQTNISAAFCTCGCQCFIPVCPTQAPTIAPSPLPSVSPSLPPTVSPSVAPSTLPSAKPSPVPSVKPTALPSVSPSLTPTITPSIKPTPVPSIKPTSLPSVVPSIQPTALPTIQPSTVSAAPSTAKPSVVPTALPSTSSVAPTTALPSIVPTAAPLVVTSQPTSQPTPGFTQIVPAPTSTPSHKPSPFPTSPTMSINPQPTESPTKKKKPWWYNSQPPTQLFPTSPTMSVTPRPSTAPASVEPSAAPSKKIKSEAPTPYPTSAVSESPSTVPWYYSTAARYVRRNQQVEIKDEVK